MDEASIVFRNAEMASTGKMYVDKLEAAAELTVKYRNASHFVDVITTKDEVVFRWEQGFPDWKLGEVKPIKQNTEVYRFERPKIPAWDPEKRLRSLIDGLQLAFDMATGCGTRDEILAKKMTL